MPVEPIHIATIRGRQLRFFKTPNTDGLPDLPWLSVEDLRSCMGLPRSARRLMLRMERASEFKGSYRDVATAEGIVTIAPHFVAQGTIDAMKECLGELEDVERGYTRGSFAAYKQLTGDLSFVNGGLEYMVAAANRHGQVGE
jgi:hypothetical protein